MISRSLRPSQRSELRPTSRRRSARSRRRFRRRSSHRDRSRRRSTGRSSRRPLRTRRDHELALLAQLGSRRLAQQHSKATRAAAAGVAGATLRMAGATQRAACGSESTPKRAIAARHGVRDRTLACRSPSAPAATPTSGVAPSSALCTVWCVKICRRFTLRPSRASPRPCRSSCGASSSTTSTAVCSAEASPYLPARAAQSGG